MKEISVVIPTYKRPGLLIDCLRCLEKQTLPLSKFETIVVSDGFDELTFTALQSFTMESPLNLHYMNTPLKNGPAAARNMGWQNAEAKLIAFTDDDCRPDENWLLSILSCYHGEKLMVFSGFTRVPLPENPTDFALNTSHLQNAQFITANCACTRQALALVNGFDERFETAWREDSDLEFRFLKEGVPLVKVQTAVVVHPVRNNVPWGVSIQEQKKGLYDALLYKKHPRLYRERIQAGPLWFYYTIVFSMLLFTAATVKEDTRLATLSGTVFIILISVFFMKRLMPVSKKPAHITEMLITSLVIPFASVYWRIYGSFKYRVFFI